MNFALLDPGRSVMAVRDRHSEICGCCTTLSVSLPNLRTNMKTIPGIVILRPTSPALNVPLLLG